MLQPLLFTSSDSHQFYVFFFSFIAPLGTALQDCVSRFADVLEPSYHAQADQFSVSGLCGSLPLCELIKSVLFLRRAMWWWPTGAGPKHFLLT